VRVDIQPAVIVFKRAELFAYLLKVGVLRQCQFKVLYERKYDFIISASA
jgi:hypothetical protein